MGFTEFEKEIKTKKGNFQDITIRLEIKTKEEVDELIRVFSNEQLRIGQLSIHVDDSIADDFVAQLVKINPKHQIKILSLDMINLSHQSWGKLFKTLETFPQISGLLLRHSNFDYTVDLDALGNYLASNPNMESINLHHKNKSSDTTYSSGSEAMKLLAYLSTNTNLIHMAYGDPDNTSLNHFSKELRLKFITNDADKKYRRVIASKVSKLLDEGFTTEIHNKLTKLAKDLVITEASFLDKNSMNENFKVQVKLKSDGFSHELTVFREDFKIAKKDELFLKNDKAINLANMGLFFIAQENLLISLRELKAQGDKASAHDKPILLGLGDDILRSWKIVVEIQDPSERNKRTADMLREFQDRCKTELDNVNDGTSGALIKNVLLMISAILTCGISLGIYALVTKQSRADSKNFFFKNVEASKDSIQSADSIQEVANDLENFETRFKNLPSAL